MDIIEVKTRSHLRRFLKLPDNIYNNNTYYVAPLNVLMKSLIGRLNRPQKHLLIASENRNDVARIAFKVHKYKSETYLHFGFFECKESYGEAAKKLIAWGQNKYPHLPLKGPYHFTMEDPYIGILVEGFEQMPYFLMSYNLPYYDSYLQDAGLTQAMNLFTYPIIRDTQLDFLKEQVQKAENHDITVRFVNAKEFNKEARIVAGIFNQALSNNWGFEEFQENQIREMVSIFKFIIDPRTVALAVKDGKDIGCLIMLPNYNPILKPHKGKITPTLIYKYLRRYKLFESIRGYALGVLKEHHHIGIASLLITKMFERARKCGYKTCEVSWVLSNNESMNSFGQSLSKTGKHSKIYRVYEAPALKSQ